MTIEERNRIVGCRPPPFPEDFGERLEDLKDLAGVSWAEFAELLGVTQRGLLKWRRGGPPSGAYFWAIIELARDVPGGYETVMYGAAGTEERKDTKGGNGVAGEETDRIEDFRAPPFPEDFPAHLVRLEDLSGISLEEFAGALGLPEERPREWRGGAMPTAGEVWAMARWASGVPGGLSVLLTGCLYSLTVKE